MLSSRLLVCLIALIAIAADSLAGEDPRADLGILAKDADFQTQGEYSGDQAGMQVIALGDGEFDLVIYEGGLPGAGAKMASARRVEGDADTVADLVESMKLTKVKRKSPTAGMKPPAGSIVLFDGTKKSATENWDGGRVTDHGLLMEGTTSKQKFDDYRLHLEFRTPFMPTASGQKRGNSGVYHQGRFETQVLDSFGLEGADNETGGIYTVSAPSVNICFPPMSWQTYDVDFTAARYDDSGKKTSDAKMTVRLNGIVVQSDVSVPAPTRASKVKAGPEPGPIYLQNHGDPVRFRNIWLQPIDAEREAMRPIVPGFERFFAASSEPSADGGEVLISSLACAACHNDDAADVIPEKRGPDLSAVAKRLRPDAIVDMIAHPHTTKHGTSMPDPWPGASDADRKEHATAIANYLIGGDDRPVRTLASAETMDQGNDLYHSIGCVACHETRRGNPSPVSTTVQLGDLSRKYTLASLSTFLLNPHQVRPGLRMPGLTGSASEANAVAAYLLGKTVLGDNSVQFKRKIYHGEWNKLPDFSKLTPVKEDMSTGLKLDDAGRKNNFAVVFSGEILIQTAGEYVVSVRCDDGGRVRVGDELIEYDGVHPAATRSKTMTLAEGIHPVTVEYFQGGGEIELSATIESAATGKQDLRQVLFDRNAEPEEPVESDAFVFNRQLVPQGRQFFMSSGCVNCHKTAENDQSSPTEAMSFQEIANETSSEGTQTAGCLADHVKAPAVDFRLNAAQRSAIAAAIQRRASGGERKRGDANALHLQMAALNCYACHDRDGIGGREISRDEVFVTTTPEMGLEGRLPPSLSGVGDKLNDAYVAKLFNQGAAERPYMKTRMPKYTAKGLADLHQAFVRLDRKSEAPTAQQIWSDAPPKAKDLAAAGRQCVGNKGLACIKCHSFGGDKGGGIGAIDMLKMTERLRRDWFQRYLMDPPKFRPGTRMPKSFVDGKSALDSLYSGDPDKQVDAMWRYLEAGKDAREPVGLKVGAIVLAADERPLIYRNFFTDVSARGIGVAYPDRVNIIWDAERMGLARLWKNSFVDASMHWVNRGQGRQSPLGDAVLTIEKQSPFATLDAIDSPWPEQVARDRGSKFKGYEFDRAGLPTFRFLIDSVVVADKVVPTADPQQTRINRTLTFDHTGAAKDQTLVWLIAEGKLESIGDQQFRTEAGATITVEGVDAQIVETTSGQQLRALIPQSARRVEQSIAW